MSNVSQKLASKGKSSGGKQVRLRLVHVDVWSATRLAFLLSLVLSLAMVLATFLIWLVASQAGLFAQLNSLLSTLSAGDQSFNVTSMFGIGRLMGFSLLLAVVSTVFGTLFGFLCALLYNLAVRVSGGLIVGFTNAK